MLEFKQSIYKTVIKCLDGCVYFDTFIDSGKCIENNHEFISSTMPPSDIIIDKITKYSLFASNYYNAKLLIETLLLLSERANRYNFIFTFFLTEQSEYIRIDNLSIKEDFRNWSTIKIGLTSDNGKSIYKDTILEKDIFKTIEKVNKIFNLMIEEIQLTKYEITLPESPTSIIFAEGTGGFLVHEILGHMVEGDFITRGVSLFGNKINIGERVGIESLNVIDNPCGFSDFIGLCNIDDEGEMLKKINIISNGILTGYICDKYTAQQLNNLDFCGCARRQSYRFKAIPRMRATFILSNNHGPDCESIVSSTSAGIYIENIHMGQVNPTNGNYFLLCGKGFIIDKGKLKQSISNFFILDNIINTLSNIEFIGNDFYVLPTICTKGIQSIPVCVGSPTIKINKINITNSLFV